MRGKWLEKRELTLRERTERLEGEGGGGVWLRKTQDKMMANIIRFNLQNTEFRTQCFMYHCVPCLQWGTRHACLTES